MTTPKHMSTVKHDDFYAHVLEDRMQFKQVNDNLAGLKKDVKKWGLIGGLIAGFASAGVHLAGCAGSLPAALAGETGRANSLNIATYGNKLLTCVTDNDTRKTIDACRSAARKQFCGEFPREENCIVYTDGGAE